MTERRHRPPSFLVPFLLAVVATGCTQTSAGNDLVTEPDYLGVLDELMQCLEKEGGVRVRGPIATNRPGLYTYSYAGARISPTVEDACKEKVSWEQTLERYPPAMPPSEEEREQRWKDFTACVQRSAGGFDSGEFEIGDMAGVRDAAGSAFTDEEFVECARSSQIALVYEYGG